MPRTRPAPAVRSLHRTGNVRARLPAPSAVLVAGLLVLLLPPLLPPDAPAVAVPAMAAELTGRVEVANRRGAPIRGEASRVVVWFEPEAQVDVPTPDAPLEMVTRDKEFVPRVLVVPRGGSVRFPNRDPILHNVFSVSQPQRFDLGLYGEGPGETVTFDSEGVVRVFCNVHSDMVGYVLVLDTPFHTTPDASGRFRLEGLPPGPGRLVVWHDQAVPQSRSVTLGQRGARPVEMRLELTRPRVPPHLNKSGRRYGRSLRDRYRNPPGP